jgi:hypothetical protein
MSMPKRIQLSRKRGWRKPEGAIVVSRPSQWGNDHVVGDPGVPDWATAQRLHEENLTEVEVVEIKRELPGHDLACWCPLDQPCHADTLLKIANEP